jgi:hypothetical protein
MTGEQALARAKQKDPNATAFVVRLYDGFDNCWMDVLECDPAFGGHVMDAEEVVKLWLEKTENGTKKIGYGEIDYYAIYPVTVTMVNSEKGNAELGIKTIR